MDDVRASLNSFRRIRPEEDEGDVLPELQLRGAAHELDVEAVIASLDASEIEVEYLPGHSFTAIFHGATLIPFGGLLRLAGRGKALERYRMACREAAERAVFAAERRLDGELATLPGRLSVSCYFSGGSPIENGDLAASCQFLLDGFRKIGLLDQENPQQIAAFDCFLQRCGSGESPSVGLTFRQAYKS